jgi:hypothetical protein
VLRENNGVLLRYHPDALGRHHVEQRPQPSDRERAQLIAAEREILTMAILFDHLDLSSIARTRLDDALARIRRALNIRRRQCDMTAVDEVVA